MKRLLLKSMLVILAIAIFLALATVAVLHRPVFGQLPEGHRLVRIHKSPNYRDGAFQNLVDTPFLTNGATELSIRIDNFFAEKGMPRPVHSLPSQKTNLKTLNPREDLAIWLGHSSWYVQLGGKRILIDPVFSDHAAPFPGLVAAFEGTNIYSASDMPPIDLLLISHDHYDHLDYPTVRALEPLVKDVVVGLGVGADFEAWGYAPEKIHELDWYESYHAGSGMQVHATPARHYSGRTLTFNQTLWVGFALESSQRRLFISGDTGYGDHFAEIGRRYGPFDWATVDSGQYDARWSHLHMNPEEAAQAASDVGASAVTPDHIGRFALASHNWDDPFKRFMRAAQNRTYALWMPVIGQPIYLDGREQLFSNWWEAVN